MTATNKHLANKLLCFCSNFSLLSKYDFFFLLFISERNLNMTHSRAYVKRNCFCFVNFRSSLIVFGFESMSIIDLNVINFFVDLWKKRKIGIYFFLFLFINEITYRRFIEHQFVSISPKRVDSQSRGKILNDKENRF